MRPIPRTVFFLLLSSVIAGCSTSESFSPEEGELERYLQANPEAAALRGQGEPAGFGSAPEVPR
ncbi:hypothetical protein [Allorhodopirellula solitaria]|uniref:Uncharacterized protein n=1 Tax=Allorhodopirellula solitaria TaxID=2527987 RepID=A0A5C5XQZ2_9BACT|nr:hypothetical protein [Allorhodopirellula solitaria]TWT65320.1 hypothetical protein CA85_32320 [Allorhodopirellula solitaria]